MLSSSLAFLALAASAVNAMPQGVTESIAPSAPIPAGCSKDFSGSFQVTTVNVTSPAKRDLSKRQAGILTLTLADSILKDASQRIGYIASNFQFQFDGPPQAGAIFTSGFSVCGNGSLALGGSAIFYQCYSGGFYNLYDRNWAPQCSPIYIQVIGAGSGGAPQMLDGQPNASQKPDGQPQASPVSQVSDGQPQATSAGKPVSQVPDGQPQGGMRVSQIADGQPQAIPVSENSDGQPQATAPAAAPVSQLKDGQPQATSASPKSPVSQAGDGQPQATAGSTGSAPRPSTSAVQFPGAANNFGASLFGVAAAVVGAVALL